MKLVGVRDRDAWVESEPALATLCRGARVPRGGHRLNTAVGKIHEVLLKRIDAERVADHVVMMLAVGALRVHDELVATAKEHRRDAAGLESRAVEAAEHSRGRRVLHGDRVLGCLPRGVLGCVTARASRRADELGRRLRFARAGDHNERTTNDASRPRNQRCKHYWVVCRRVNSARAAAIIRTTCSRSAGVFHPVCEPSA